MEGRGSGVPDSDWFKDFGTDVSNNADPETLQTQTAVDRARAQSNVVIRHATAELRRLQTDRYLLAEMPASAGGAAREAEGLVSHKEVARTRLLTRRVSGLHRFETIFHPGRRTCLGRDEPKEYKSKPTRRGPQAYLSNVMLESALNFR